MSLPSNAPALNCPSAQPVIGATVYGVVSGKSDTPRIAYLTDVQPVTPALLALAGDAEPGQVFRTASSCMKGACRHFAGAQCTLAERIVQSLGPVVRGLPPCRIRKTCLWFHQEGKAACLRCPQVVTNHSGNSPLDLWIDGSVRHKTCNRRQQLSAMIRRVVSSRLPSC